jgi:molecular chaperone DnaK
MSEIAIGIDLGTSNSCVAVLRDGTPEVLPNAQDEYTTASVVAMREDGTIAVGNAARANIIHDAEHTVCSAKRLIGRHFDSEEVRKARAISAYEIVGVDNGGLRIRIRKELFSIPEISAMILRELKSIAEMRLGQPVGKAVITVPANFNDNQRQATKDAGRVAGLDVLRILNEPTAAALAYGFGRGLTQQVAVYDLGGGTFDISVLEIGTDVFEVLSTCGDTFLGGDDFDDRLIDLLADEFLAREGINLRNDPFALEKLKVAAERGKKEVSLEPEVEIHIPDVAVARDGSTRLSLRRTLRSEEFGQLVQDLLQRTFKVCDAALSQAGIVARDLDGVILVGGPTRLPFVRTAVRDYFQQEPKTNVDPDRVVAVGAAIHAATLVNTGQQAFLLDVTPLSLRIGVVGGFAETVIERNTPVPIEQTRTFTTAQDEQESVKICVYQGESREAEENELLGQFEFSGFRRAKRGEVEIDVTFEINADGIVNVTARDRETGRQASTRVTLSSGLSEPELESIIAEGRTDRVRTARIEPEVARPPSREVLGAVELVSTPVTKVPEAREARAPAVRVQEAQTEELPVLAASTELAVEAEEPTGMEGDEELLELDADEAVLELETDEEPPELETDEGPPELETDEEPLELETDEEPLEGHDESPFAEHLEAVGGGQEERPGVGLAKDASLFDAPGVDLSELDGEDEGL